MAKTTVHFATNRQEKVENGEVVDFTDQLNAKSPVWLRYGAAEMVKGRKSAPAFDVAELRVAPEQIPDPGTDPDDAHRVLGSEQVFEGLRLRLIENDADLLLLLHGYACTFPEALSNAAELKTQWGTASTPLETAVFSWPANGTMTPWLDYASDRDDARSSAKAIARSLERLMDYLGQLKRADWCKADIHLVAHSMGNYALRNALQALLSNHGGRPLPRLFKNIFLMAADEDNDAFEHESKLARLPELAETVHVYFAGNDRALTISDKSKGNPDRLGSTGPRTLTALPQKVSLVDCSEVSDTRSLTDAGHQYYRKRAEVLADVRQVLDGKRPEQVTGREWIPARTCFRIRPGRR
ncbi:MAG: alpha/beta hydrolase [Reyranella sp.]|nr:alpha/beta hydrolase [Reyranella sp.]